MTNDFLKKSKIKGTSVPSPKIMTKVRKARPAGSA